MPSFFARVWLAVVCWFRIVFNAEFAARVQRLQRPAEPLQLLAILQREGRLIDFCEEELAGFSDAQIGAAARTVHDGCRKALRSMITLEPVRTEAEGASVELPAGFDPRSVRLTGNVVGKPPFKGVLKHHGWRAAEVVIAPAE
ncbi:MAG: DUF2760 domain-containing protein, partial [Deltaproteobacteria bacterium]